ncbi:hypothetical protein [Methylobacter sp. S3L5C]|uniref:hypothetical protein n=1 Tax=Methylobacter sp. S3L5C TaxID=2839024 RepID=UPI001FABE96B|nr:hypothetical protein [Methylobacter sp. S3L5C]UOA08723.1 hypothetical protein KKZ03_21490 [Methylobacter sp. S3L5C]
MSVKPPNGAASTSTGTFSTFTRFSNTLLGSASKGIDIATKGAGSASNLLSSANTIIT